MDSETRVNRALARRDCTVWAQIYDRHVNTVFGLIYHLVGANRALAEDIHQEVWLLAIEQIDNFDAAKGDFRAWILGIARHRALRRHRRPPESTIEPASTASSSCLPSEQLESQERAGLVRAALLCLSDDRRQVLHQKYAEGLSVAEIAIQSGRSSKAVESLLSRAREQIRELLKPHLSHPVEG